MRLSVPFCGIISTRINRLLPYINLTFFFLLVSFLLVFLVFLNYLFEVFLDLVVIHSTPPKRGANSFVTLGVLMTVTLWMSSLAILSMLLTSTPSTRITGMFRESCFSAFCALMFRLKRRAAIKIKDCFMLCYSLLLIMLQIYSFFS